MDHIILEVSPEAHFYVESVGGDLRLFGWDQNQFVAESDDDRSLHVSQDGQRLHIHASADCRLRVPTGATVTVQHIGGDARVKSVLGPLTLGAVGGDLSLRQVGDTGVGRVGGDCKAKNVEGGLRLDVVGGDVQASRVAGPFNATNIGGDLYARDVDGALAVSAGGDVALSLDYQPELAYSASAGGDLTCRLNPGANVRLEINAGGDVEVNVLGARVEGQPHQRTVTLGDGQVTVALRAGGEVAITGLAADPSAMGDFGEQFGDDLGIMAEEFASQIETQIESQIESIMPDFERKLNERLADIENQFEHHFSAGQAESLAAKARRAAEKVERAAQRTAEKARRRADEARRQAEREGERARRRAEQAVRHAEHSARHGSHGRAGWVFGARPPVPPTPPVPPRPPVPPAAPVDPVTEEERMIILRMVEQGKISVADAEKLLAALENR